MGEDVINDENFGDYKETLFEAIKVGRAVYKDGVVDKLRGALGKNAMNPEHLFSSVEAILTDEIYDVQENLKRLKEPKKLTAKEKIMSKLKLKDIKKDEANKKVPDLTKLSYLSSILLETMAASQKYHTDRGVVRIATPGETAFFANQYPLILQEIDRAAEDGAEFNHCVSDLIGSINGKETYEWLKEKWIGKDSQKGSD